MYRYVMVVGKLRCDDGKFVNAEIQLHAKRLYVAPAGLAPTQPTQPQIDSALCSANPLRLTRSLLNYLLTLCPRLYQFPWI